MRVVLACEGTRGDVHPMLALAGALRCRGHDALLAAPPDFAGDAREREVPFVPVGTGVRAYLTDTASAITAGGLAVMRESQRYMESSLARQFAVLPEVCADADAVVAAGVQGAAASAAEIHGAAYLYTAYCPAFFPSLDHGPILMPFQQLPRWGNWLLWRALRLFARCTIGRRIQSHRRDLGLPPVRDVFAHLIGRSPLLAADAALAPLPGSLRNHVLQLGCLHPEDGPDLPEKLEAFLASGPPPVYLGFGSMTDPDPGRTTGALLEAVTRLGCRALISEGWAGLGAGPMSSDVFVTGPVSHPRLFPRVAAVVHHGGAGTTTSAARAGVPQLLVPHVFDQFYFAKRLHALGVAPPALPRRRLDAPSLGAALSATLDNELLAERAAELGARLRSEREAAPDPAALLERRVEAWHRAT